MNTIYLKDTVCDFSTGCGLISEGNILGTHECLMKKQYKTILKILLSIFVTLLSLRSFYKP